jgi:hypothetical protein
MTSTTVSHRVASGQSNIQRNQTSRQRTVPVGTAATRCRTVDTDWSLSFLSTAAVSRVLPALGCSGPAAPGGQSHKVQHLRRLQCLLWSFSTEDRVAHNLRQLAFLRTVGKEKASAALAGGTSNISALCANVDVTLS